MFKLRKSLNGDEEKYGGTGADRKKIYKAEKKECDLLSCTIIRGCAS
jgi:hypothetical protein